MKLLINFLKHLTSINKMDGLIFARWNREVSLHSLSDLIQTEQLAWHTTMPSQKSDYLWC